MAELQHFNIPLVGRLVWGDLTHPRTKDFEGRPIPEEDQRIEFGVAYEKQAFWAWLTGEFYPNTLMPALGGNQAAINAVNQWFQTFSGFSMKITDGDKPNTKGVVNQNTVGHFVVKFNAYDVPNCVVGEAYTQIAATEIKRGYFVTVAGSIKFNEQQGDRMGIFVNAGNVWLRAEGDVIAGGVDAETAFAGMNAAAPALPAGARPLGASTGLPGAAPGAPAPTQAATGLPPGMPPAGAPAAAPTPAPAPTLPGSAAPSAPVGAAPGTASPGGSAPYTGAMDAAAAGAPTPPLPGMPLPGTQG